MAAKKDKASVETLQADVKALTEAFWSFRDAMLTNAAVEQSEQQVAEASGDWGAPSDRDIDTAASLLAALGHPQRLRMTMMLANEPTTVTDIVETLGLKTTGAAYHHLNVLTTHGIAEQPERGIFSLMPGAGVRVHAVLTSLFGGDEQPTKKKKK
ncbi:MAG: helix-turn-helix domain-containing protein [Thermomicrobiales bacterium]|nr:helix-turn-helix domain-containing protein [Thermomicrobiales bacterium]MCO5224881.1 helix-turn-helix domain-containing protein [Thermomicrobiales bacterium]MCO5228941.1 helix-turn-helix domain-containing protein [Thermomicrobiales bacterium]